MQAVLLRIVMEPFWTAEYRDGIPHIGLGWALIPWTFLAAICLYLTHRSASESSRLQELGLTASAFAAIPAVLFKFLSRALRVDGLPIFGYGLMMFLGIVFATIFAVRNGRRLGVKKDQILDMGLWLVLPGIIGGRTFYVVQKHNEFGFLSGKTFPEALFAIVNLPNGGLVFYGAILGGLLGFLMYCRRRGLNVLLMGDIVLPSVFIGLGFGRLGCFLYGCCYGGACSLPWAVEFPKGSVPWDAQVASGFITSDALFTLPIHPTQIYSSINAFLLATVLILYLRHRPYNGAVLAVGWVVYPIARFVLELLRNDELGQFGFKETISQQISIGLFITGIVFTCVLIRTRGTMFGLNKSPTPG